ncbi:MAG: hypothetical protein ACTSPD_13230 [Promethearchaeota archaeon]
MKKILTKDSIDHSIKLISELNLNDKDFEEIFKRFNVIFNDFNTKNILQKLNESKNFKCEDGLKTIMEKIKNNLTESEMHILLEKVIKNEELIDFIQDLFLEKLI